jgi:hypothetical protein
MDAALPLEIVEYDRSVEQTGLHAHDDNILQRITFRNPLLYRRCVKHEC